MNFSIEKENFLNIINDCLKIVAIKSPQTILTYFKLIIKDKGLYLIGSNNSVSVQSFLPLKDKEDTIININKTGEICIPSRILSEIIKKFPSETIQISIVNEEMIIKKGKIKYKIKCLNADQYPKLQSHDLYTEYNIITKDLKKILRKTIYAAAATKQRPFLTGINWIIKNKNLTCIATDNHRLSKIKINFDSEEEKNIIIPRKNLEELNKFLINDDKIIKIYFLDRQIIFKIDNILFYSRLLEGIYPDVERIIPQEIKSKILVKAKILQHALERVSIITKEEKETTIYLEIKNDNIKIESLNTSIGEVVEEIPVIGLEGENINLAVNPQYFLDILKTVDKENLVIQYTGESAAIILKEESDENSIQLILPIKH